MWAGWGGGVKRRRHVHPPSHPPSLSLTHPPTHPRTHPAPPHTHAARSLLVLGLFGVTNSLAFFWLLLVLFLQRGPIVPCANELSPLPVGGGTRAAAIAALLLPLLVLLPYPTLGGGGGGAELVPL